MTLRETVARRLPSLATALMVYRYLREQQRRYARAGRDTRPLGELVRQSGELLQLDGHELGELRLSLGEVAASQKVDELMPFLERAASLGPRAVCEIGTSAAGTLFLLTRVAADDAVVVSVDLEIAPHLAAARSRFARERQEIVSIAGDSHSEETFARVKAVLDGRPLDVLFIDADHSYEGVKRDWELYSALVRPGGIVGLHDIHEDYATSRGTPTNAISGDVPRFWQELRQRHRSEELIADPEQDGFGIGLVYV
jgi:predicted O-methyltransferase YrrM